MHARILTACAATLALAACQTPDGGNYGGGYGGADRDTTPGGDYERVSDLVALPDFIPGMGTLYVQPATLPAGPFLAYDRNDRHVSTVYMIPLEAMNEHADWSGLAAPGHEVVGVDVTFSPAHPGVEEPHYHVTLWHVPEDEAALQ